MSARNDFRHFQPVAVRSFRHEYAVFRRGGDEVVADGYGVIAWVDYAAARAIPLPEGLREAIRRYEAGE